ncbi:GNAT family N-acetyltransferase [Isoptericola halotolerans]|uniref:GNAT superfamily N-acetyltransferase n=1 Tax=Isoptericola halotolerans TaxID=300560 RepID=A0ABX1ZYW6_9MICO|nr:GNAT family N-acetyltransferase [Isoptericola halotolerans]NOV95800.1 GNAT superfamily N-acetyltransferase [Isoptericola halotolerans]
MLAPFTLRAATPDDAAGCALVHHTSWVETYSGLLRADHWDTDTLERRTLLWQRWLAGDGVVVAEAGGRVVGIASDGSGRTVGGHEPVRERELYLLYVLQAHHGSGAGQALLDAVLPPYATAQLWVAEHNPRARRFYERNGFVPDGARCVDEQLGLAEVRHVR